ncbi:DUF6412 domain-containing protein [Microbacterium pumilum]|uniref:Uncharacterized protein n=1 Tax=Microbacterium pumilum TaxID=344165 RepID=A0ABP5ECD8_9MICO
MFDSLTSALQLLLATLGLIATSDPGSIGALGVTLALVSAAVLLTSLLTLTLPDAGRSSPAHPARAMDISSPLSQSDPDASGHPRPRAPGLAASVA